MTAGDSPATTTTPSIPETGKTEPLTVKNLPPPPIDAPLHTTSVNLGDLPFEVPQLEQMGLQPRVREVIDAAVATVLKSPSDASKAGELGMLYYNAACPMAAASCFKYAAGIEPNVVRWRYYLALCHLSAYNTAEAAAAFEAARKLDPKYAPILVELGRLRLQTDVAAARQLFQQAMELSPREARAYFGLGECARLKGDHAAAIEQYRKALELAPNYADAHRSLASSLKATGKEPEAKEHLAVRMTGGRPPTTEDPLLVDLLTRATAGPQLLELAKALVDAGRVEQAIHTLRTAVDKDNSDVSARGALGLLFDLTGQSREAVQQFRIILSKNPNDFNLVLNLARALTNAREYDEAERYYKEILNSEPRNTRAVALYAWHLLRCCRAEEAVKYFERSVQLKSDDKDSHLALASALVCLQRYDAAVDRYRRALMLKTDGGDLFPGFAWRLLGVMMEQLKTEVPAQAPETPSAQVAVSPKAFLSLAAAFETKQMPSEAAAARRYSDIILQRATSCARAGFYDDALGFVRLSFVDEEKKGDAKIIGELKKILAANPADAAVHHLLAIVYMEIGDRAAAKEQWRTLAAAQPKFILAHIALALETMRERDFAQARRYLEDGLRHEPKSPWLANALAWVLATAPDEAQRDPAAALTWAKKACDATGHKNPVFLDTLAAAHAVSGQFEEAARVEQEAIKLASDIGQSSSIPTYRERMKLYEKKQPYVQAKSIGEAPSGG